EIDAAACVMDRGIGLDVRVLTAELEGVLASQIRDAVREIVERVGAIFHGTAAPTADLSTETGDGDGWKAAVIRDARVEGVALPIGERVAVEWEKQLPIAAVAQLGFVHDAR